MKIFRHKLIRNKKGITLILIALFLVLLLAFAALAIDISYMYLAKNELQVAADAAALAGAATITGEIDNTSINPNALLQTSARQTAWRFACRNRAAGSNVYLVTNTPAGCDASAPTAENLNGGNAADGDIVVGHWRNTPPGTIACATGWETLGSGYFCRANGSTGLSVNALKARPLRTGAAAVTNEKIGGNPVSLFLGGVLRALPVGAADWRFMSVRAEAIAAKGKLSTSGISICLQTCNLSPSDLNPLSLSVQEQTANSPYGLAWTELNQVSSIGTQSCTNNSCGPLDSDCATNNAKLVAATIWGLVSPPNVCGQSITTKNGVSNALDDLGCAFKSLTYDTENKDISGGVVNKWRIIVPVQEKCPAGKEPGPWPVIRYARIEIKGVFDEGGQGGLKGIKITDLECVTCEEIPSKLGGKGVALVR